MTVRNDSIDRRLEFLKKDYQRGLPPVAYERPPASMAAAGPKKPYLKSSTIAPSKKNRQLMRQVSALGMEDPVFGTTEDGPQHPSNIFDDMSLGDVPEDMRDLVSIASDLHLKKDRCALFWNSAAWYAEKNVPELNLHL